MGFEPTTFCMASRRSSQLSYSRTTGHHSLGRDRFATVGTPLTCVGDGLPHAPTGLACAGSGAGGWRHARLVGEEGPLLEARAATVGPQGDDPEVAVAPGGRVAVGDL